MAADTVRGARRVGRYALLIALAAVVLFPIYAVVLQALKSGPDSLDHPRSLLPVDLTLSTIRAAWDQGDLGRLLMNSMFVSVVVTIGVVITSLLAAYAFADFIEGLANVADKTWYASLMLNRLMFVYFIQKKGFLDKSETYLGDG